MRKSIYFLLGSMLGCGLLAACEEEDRTYGGPFYYEFSAERCGQTNYRNILLKESAVIGEDSICVQLIKPSAGPVRVDYRVVDQVFYMKNKSAYVFDLPDGLEKEEYELYRTDAVYDVDYKIGTGMHSAFDPKYGRGSVVIPGGEMFGYIPVEMLKKSGTGLYIVLEDSPDARANRPTALLNWQLLAGKTFYLQESFAGGLPDAWTVLDKDGDGFTWEPFAKYGCMLSESYREDALTPENYLISPPVTIPAEAAKTELSFEIAATGNSYFEEQYKVIVSEEPITLDNCSDIGQDVDFIKLTEEYSGASFVVEKIDLTRYAGKTIYIGFVHANCSDQDALVLRNINIYSY